MGDILSKMPYLGFDAAKMYHLAVRIDSTSCGAHYGILKTASNMGIKKYYNRIADLFVKIMCVTSAYKDVCQLWLENIMHQSWHKLRLK